MTRHLKGKIQNARDNFFRNVVTEILKAIQGDCLLSSFTLTFCGIGALASLANVANGNILKTDNEQYRQWVRDWLRPLNRDYNDQVLYAYRCALVHTHGSAKAFTAINLKPYVMTHDQPNKHWHWDRTTSPNTPWLNLESLVSEFSVAAFNFFEIVEPIIGAEAATEAELDSLIAGLYVDVSGVAESKQVDKRPFAEKHELLSAFDTIQSDADRIAKMTLGIQEIYKKIGRSKGSSPSSMSVLTIPATGSM